MRWFGSRNGASAVPSPHVLLRGIYTGRISLAVAIYLTTAFKVSVAQPLDVLLSSLLLLVAIVFTGASYWHANVRTYVPGRTFLYLQAVFDLALITTVVHMTGGNTHSGQADE